MIPLKTVTGSAQIAAYAFDPADRVLYVRFHSSTMVYGYQAVPPEVAEAFEAAESKGKAFYALIRGKYQYTNQDLEPAEKPLI